MSINLFAEAGESNLIRMMKVGCLSLMSNYLIFATGVANLIMMTRLCYMASEQGFVIKSGSTV